MVAQAGQITMENYYGAVLFFAGDIGTRGIPCTASQVLTDFDLVPGGKSPKSVVETCNFLKDNVGDFVPAKGIFCQLKQTGDGPVISMMFWSGGMLPDGETYQFMLVDANYRA